MEQVKGSPLRIKSLCDKKDTEFLYQFRATNSEFIPHTFQNKFYVKLLHLILILTEPFRIVNRTKNVPNL